MRCDVDVMTDGYSWRNILTDDDDDDLSIFLFYFMRISFLNADVYNTCGVLLAWYMSRPVGWELVRHTDR